MSLTHALTDKVDWPWRPKLSPNRNGFKMQPAIRLSYKHSVHRG